MCRITTAAITKGSRKCSEKKRLSDALPGAKPPSSQVWIGSPTTGIAPNRPVITFRSEEHTSELQSLMRISYAVFCLKKKKPKIEINEKPQTGKSYNRN